LSIDNGSFKWPPEGSAGASGVSSLNTQTGDIVLVAGSNITITPGAGTLTIASGGGSTTRIVELFTLNSGQEAAKQIVLGATPIIANFTVLEIASAPSQFYGLDFTVSGNILSWSGLGLDGILAAGDNLTVTYN
jgi:hypothetical protein